MVEAPVDHLLEGEEEKRGCLFSSLPLSLSASMRLEVLAPSHYLNKPHADWRVLEGGVRKGGKNPSLPSAVRCHDPCILVTSPAAGTRPHLEIVFAPSRSYSSTFSAWLRGKRGRLHCCFLPHKALACVWNSSRTSLTTACEVNVNTVRWPFLLKSHGHRQFF